WSTKSPRSVDSSKTSDSSMSSRNSVEHLAGNEPRNVVGRGRLSQPRGDAGQELGDATERELVLGHHGPRLGRGHGLGGHAADREAGGGEELGEHANRGSHP